LGIPIGVSATLAVEFKMKAGVGAGIDAEILKAFAELDFGHARRLSLEIRICSKLKRDWRIGDCIVTA
jgi:hypothetical protein